MELAKPPNLADRQPEFRSLASALTGSPPIARCIVLRANEATGTTYFARALASSKQKKVVFHYYDAARSAIDPAESMIAAIARRTYCGRLKVAIAREGRLGLAMKLILRLLPIFGHQLAVTPSGIFDNLPVVRLSQYPSVPVEILAKTLRGALCSGTRYVLLVDNAQDKVSSLQELLAGLHSSVYSRLTFGLFYVERKQNQISYKDWIERIKATAVRLIERTFAPPSIELVEDYAFLQGRSLGRSASSAILETSRGDMYSIVNAVGRESTDALQANPQLQEYIVAALDVASQPLRFSDVRMLVLTTQLVFLGAEDEITNSIRHLETSGVIESLPAEDSDRLLRLLPTSSPTVARARHSAVLPLAIANELYDYYRRASTITTKQSPSATVRLLYRLAHTVDPQSVARYAQSLVRYALEQGNLQAAKRFVDDIASTSTVLPSDLYLRVALLVSVQEYLAAADCLKNAPPEWREIRVFRIFKAIIKNRLRAHQSSIADIDRLIDDDPSAEERSILVSYKIAGLMHEQFYEEARSLFEEELPKLEKAGNFGYYLRNGSSVFLWGQEPDYQKAAAALQIALRIFKKGADWLGFYTAVSNLGTISAYRGLHDAAVASFSKSFSMLSVFGTHHLEECGYNLAVSCAVAGDRERALFDARKMAVYFERGNFPMLQLRSLIAVLCLERELDEEARAQVSEAKLEARLCDLVEAKIYVLCNAALVSYVLEDHQSCRQELAEAKQLQSGGSKWSVIRRLEDGISLGTLSRQTAFEYLSFDYHQYWSQNPFEMVPVASLTFQAEGQDVRH